MATSDNRHSTSDLRAISVPVLRFTDLSIKALPEGIYFDERTPSFGIRVGKNRKTWLVVKEPNRTKVRLGHYPDLSLADARKRALVAIGSPLEPSHAPTFPDARAEYLAQGKWRPKTRYETTRTLKRHFHWTKTLDKITHRDVLEAVAAIQAPAEARAAQRDLSIFFRWCVPRYLKHSPCEGLKSPTRYIPRSRVLSDDELRKVWHAAPDDVYGATIKLLILLGQRIGETSAMRPEWITKEPLKNHLSLSIPAIVTKNGREHVIPIPRIANELIPTLRPFVGYGKCKARLDKASGVTSWTHHDLRRGYATTMQRLGVRLEVTERLLNHISGTQSGIVAVYQRHDFWPEMVEAVAKYSDWLETLLAR